MLFLEALFSDVSERKIEYFVIGDYFDLPSYSGRTDLDLFVSGADLNEFLVILGNNVKLFNGKLISYFTSNNGINFRFIGYHDEWWGIQMDIIHTKFEYLTKEYFPLEGLKMNIMLHNKIKVVDYRIGYFEGFLKELIHNQKVKEKYLQNCKDMIVNERSVLINSILPLYSIGFFDLLSDELKKEKFDDIKVSKAIHKEIFRFEFLEHCYSFTKIKFFKRIFQKSGITICFLGTDGAGKSTLIDQITPVLKKAFHKGVYYEHLRPNYFPDLSKLFHKNNATGTVNTPHDNQQSGLLISLIRFGYYLLDYSLGYFIKIFPKLVIKSNIWIFDRYYYDYYFDQKRSCINLPKWVIRIGQLFIPEPDIIICLGTDPRIIHNRKPELPLNEIESQINSLKKFTIMHNRAIWVDTGGSISDSCDLILNHIVDLMAKRYENTKLI